MPAQTCNFKRDTKGYLINEEKQDDFKSIKNVFFENKHLPKIIEFIKRYCKEKEIAPIDLDDHLSLEKFFHEFKNEFPSFQDSNLFRALSILECGDNDFFLNGYKKRKQKKRIDRF